jgi:hypothetical protein
VLERDGQQEVTHPDKDHHHKMTKGVIGGRRNFPPKYMKLQGRCLQFEGQACSQPTLFPSLLKNPRQRITVAFDSSSHISPSPCTHLWIDPILTVNQKLTLFGIATQRKANSNSGRAMKSSPIWTNVSNKKGSAC